MRKFKEYTCPICGTVMKQPRKHWKSCHQDITWIEYIKLYQGQQYCRECGKPIDPVVIGRVPKFCGYSCEMKFRNKLGNGVVSRKCPICGREFRGFTGHWKENHSEEISLELFLAKLQGLEEIPKCKFCGKLAEYSWSNRHYKQTCGDEICESKLQYEHVFYPKCLDEKAYLYLIGVYDTIGKGYCVKCGISFLEGRRIDFFKAVGYNILRYFRLEGGVDEIVNLEISVHTNSSFLKYKMDYRSISNTSNGYTEWYQPTELYKIKSFIESQGYALTEIKL